MNRPDIEGIRGRADDPLQDLMSFSDRNTLLSYISDLEQERDEAVEAHIYVLEGNACLAERLARAEKVVEVAKALRDECLKAHPSGPMMRRLRDELFDALGEWEGK